MGGGANSVAVSRSALERPRLVLSGPLFENERAEKTFLEVKLFPSLDERLQTESSNYCKLINGWVWFESQTCGGWLKGNLCEVWGLKT